MNMSSHYLRIFQQPKSAILLILGFASGLPLALTSGTLQAWMTVENIDLKTIGFFSLVGQAYVFKFLWSPVMDRYTPPFLGRRRGWLVMTQVLLLIAIAAMGFLEPTTQLRWMAALAVVIAFCSASQDIVFDAWKTDVLPAEERGAGAAISVLGYRLGMLVSGGLALWVADRYLGWQGMYWLMAALLIPCIIATLLAPEPSDVIPVPRSLEQAVAEPLRDFFGRNNAWLILLLIVLYKLGDAFAMSLTTTFLIRGVGFDAGEVGVVNKTLGLFATQFALLSALSAVGRVYVGPIAGWFVEAHGWPTFYLFSVVAAVPGLLLLLVCRQTLEYTQRTEHFMPRTEYHRAYRFALRLLMAGCFALLLWLVVLIINATTSLVLPLEALLLDAGALLAVAGILTGGLLDFMALRKTQLT